METRTRLLILAVFIVTLPVSGKEFRAKVVRILDGDTIEVLRAAPMATAERWRRSCSVTVVASIENWYVPLAWHYKRYSSNGELAALESAARAGRLGLWADPRPVPPWEFRRRQKPAPVGNRLRRFMRRK